MRKEFILVVLFAFFAITLSIISISTASAEVWFISQPETLYNIGDQLEVSIAVPQAGEQLEVEIDCKNRTKTIFLKYLEAETTVNILQPLSKSFLGDIRGWCEIVARYRQESAKSSKFAISYSVFLKTQVDSLNYYPGDEVNIIGEAEKANTQLLDGFFEVSFEEIGFTTTGIVDKGIFETNLTLSEDLAAGNYLINIIVYEKEGEEKTNNGEQTVSINVKQMPKEVDIALDSQSIKPGNNLNFRIMLYDQSGDSMSNQASFLIEDFEGETLMKGLVNTDESEYFYVEKDLSFGYYNIKAYSYGIYGERQFYVGENEEAEFKIINGTLTVRNIGNVKYSKAIQVKIGNIIEIINDEFEVGEEREYELMAPDGEYDIIITDGRSSAANENVALTGNAISIRELSRGFFSRNKILVWLFLLLVMGMFIFVASRRALKKRFVLSDRSFGSVGETGKGKGEGVIKVRKKEKGKASIIKEPREAEHSLVLKGQKQDTALICLKVKNEVSKISRESLEKVLRAARESQEVSAVTYKSGEYILTLFSPLITKTFRNHVPAVKTAMEMAKTLQEYNKKFKEKVEFGISVHSGDVINSLQDNKLKFTSLGNTLSLAKKIAEISQGEVLLSKEIHEKTIADIRTDKKEERGLEVFTVSKVTDTKRNRIFIQDFLKRLAVQQKE